MSKINLDHLTPDQKRCLGRVYKFIIERGRRNRAIAEKEEMATCLPASGVDTDQRCIEKG
jgi:hypothetical protein